MTDISSSEEYRTEDSSGEQAEPVEEIAAEKDAVYENEVPGQGYSGQEEFNGEGTVIDSVDAAGNEGEAETDLTVAANPYIPRLFVHDGERVTYDDPSYNTCIGIDVSSHQGRIDWQQVREDGFEFVFVRLGYRGYGEEGSLNQDEYALENIDGAHDAGLLVGAYFFSQALSGEEAAEEAAFAMSILEGRDLELPLAFDEERIKYDSARTDGLSREQFTENAQVFCEAVQSGGYDPMIYTNLLSEYFSFDLSALADYPIWYSDYEGVPQTPYDFDFWQYSETGTVAGIDGYVDLNLWMKERGIK